MRAVASLLVRLSEKRTVPPRELNARIMRGGRGTWDPDLETIIRRPNRERKAQTAKSFRSIKAPGATREAQQRDGMVDAKAMSPAITVTSA
jgi:hypothetical protein